jgi:hypothetical protein
MSTILNYLRTAAVAFAPLIPALVNHVADGPILRPISGETLNVLVQSVFIAVSSNFFRGTPQADQKMKKSMLFISCSHDYNNTLSTFAHELSRFRRDFDVEEMRGSDKQEIQREFESKKRKYDVIFVLAHGNQRIIKLAENVSLTMKSQKSLKWFGEHLNENGKVVLHCCETGAGEENIARALSRASPEAEVFASSSAINSFVGAEYDDDATPSFNDGGFCPDGRLRKGNDTTRVYRAGQLLYS